MGYLGLEKILSNPKAVRLAHDAKIVGGGILLLGRRKTDHQGVAGEIFKGGTPQRPITSVDQFSSDQAPAAWRHDNRPNNALRTSMQMFDSDVKRISFSWR